MTKCIIETTRDPRLAMQFGSKAEAVAMAKSIGWKAKDATQNDVMGFSLWAIADDHMNYVRNVHAEGATR